MNTKWLLILLLFVVSCSPAPENNESPLTAETPEANRVSFADGRVSFVPPPGFQSLTQEQIEKKYPNANAPQHVFANETQSVSVAVNFSPARISPSQLPGLKESLEQAFSRMTPGLQWQTKEFLEINGTRWIHFKFTSNAIDTEIQNDMYVTSFDGKALFFNFNSTVGEYEEAKSILEESVNSIKVRQ
jgi:hypothetical protein